MAILKILPHYANFAIFQHSWSKRCILNIQLWFVVGPYCWLFRNNFFILVILRIFVTRFVWGFSRFCLIMEEINFLSATFYFFLIFSSHKWKFWRFNICENPLSLQHNPLSLQDTCHINIHQRFEFHLWVIFPDIFQNLLGGPPASSRIWMLF